METALTGQVAIVTGAGQGIGRAIALRLAEDGMDVVVADLKGDLAAAVAAEVGGLGRRGVPLEMNVASASDRQGMIDTALDQLGRLDLLVNNAGIQRAALPLDVDEAHWDAVMDINAKAVYFCCLPALRHMLQQHSGRIV